MMWQKSKNQEALKANKWIYFIYIYIYIYQFFKKIVRKLFFFNIIYKYNYINAKDIHNTD